MMPTGSAYEPASEPSARSAVRTTPLGCAAAAGGPAAGAGTDAGRASLKPHDAQNLLFGGLGCSHWGQMIGGGPAAAAAVAGAAAAAGAGAGAAAGDGA